ncbi:hypothetical protein HYY75_12510, partial [bacterium]|nr:hypothetical protein [bacterium]
MVPVLIFHFDAVKEREQVKAEAKRDWLEKSSTHVEQIQRMVRPNFWVEEMARRLKVRFSKFPAHDRSDEFGKSLSLAFKGSKISGTPKVKIWGVRFHGNQANRFGELCGHHLFEKDWGAFIVSLLLSLAKSSSNPDIENSPRVSSTWLNRLKLVFGDGINEELFSANFRGKAFPVIVGGNYGIAVWDFLGRVKNPLGAFLLVMKSDQSIYQTALTLCANKWLKLSRFPVFLKIPGSPWEPCQSPVMPPKIPQKMFLKWLTPFQKMIQIK